MDHYFCIYSCKVETIGDAYMVVGGVPEVTLLHAQHVANFALNMVRKAAEVVSPACGKPIQVHYNFHKTEKRICVLYYSYNGDYIEPYTLKQVTHIAIS